MGKSIAAWKSIADDSSVCYISYRRTLSSKTAADQQIQLYNEITGDIHFDEKLRTRVVVQVDSLTRVTGTPSTVIADELHGIYRQIFSNPSRSKSAWEKFDGLITTAKHFIALDADANDDDKKILSMIRPGIKFIINDYKPDNGKRFYLENSHDENYQLLWKYLDDPTKRCGAQRRNIPEKHYHADTDYAVKHEDFSDHVAAFADTRIVIFNHTLEAGVSIVDKQVDILFVFSFEVGSVEATKQAIHRFRNISEIHYSVVRKISSGLPVTREDIITRIINNERNLTATERDNRLPNISDINKSFGQAYISYIVEENNSRCFFTPRLIESLRRTGYSVVTVSPMDYPTWKSTKKSKLDKILEKYPDNKNVSNDLLMSFGERVKNANLINKPEITDSDIEHLFTGKLPNRINYYDYHDNDVKSSPYQQKLKYLNAVYQCDVSRLPPEQIEQHYKKIPAALNYREKLVADVNHEMIFQRKVFRGDRLSPREIDEIITAVIKLAKLPSVIPDDITTTSIPVTNLNEAISAIISDKQRYDDVVNNFPELFPGTRLKSRKTTDRRNIIEKLKMIYRRYGAELTAHNKKDPQRGNYTLTYPSWPIPDCLCDSGWRETFINDDYEIGGKDVNADDDHTAWLKFHVWVVNGWLTRYQIH
ncbi:hypothetical protein ACJMK2_004613 [Sinanodonta woodiana]|uniref:Replication origin-binding protein domain-containing protein n=1 Tax=Sinanodonta woodiana TaxID=1069815 RepID=A0ABD3Y3J9_SINWO